MRPRRAAAAYGDFKPLSRLAGAPWARKHGKNSTITTSRALNKPPPMALKTCAAITTTALRAEQWVRATFPPLDVDAKAQAASVSN